MSEKNWPVDAAPETEDFHDEMLVGGYNPNATVAGAKQRKFTLSQIKTFILGLLPNRMNSAEIAITDLQNIEITGSNGLTGGGDLTANRTISGINASTSAKGVVQLNDTFTSTSTVQAATPSTVKTLNDNKAEKTTTISASNGLAGGGDLSANRTISGINATTSAKGVVQLNDTFTSTSVTQAATPSTVKTLNDYFTINLASLNNSLELPTIGESINIGSGDELILDGTYTEGITSNRNVPVQYSEDYAPAVVIVDGESVANPVVKFSNRGAHGFFGSYTNIWQEPFIIGNSAAITQQGDWTCIENTTGTSQGYLRKDLTANTTSIYGTFKIRKGSTGVIQVNISNFTPALVAFIFNLNTQTFVPIAGTFDELSYVEYEAGQLYEVHFRISGGSGSSQSVFFYGTQGTAIGDYNCYKDIMIVEEVSYRVPYVEGTHQQSYGVFNYNWSNAPAWTIEGWFNPVTLDSGRTILDATDDSFKNGVLLQINTINKLELVVADATSEAFLSGTIAENTFVHFKIIIKASSVAFYINGSLIGTSSSIVPTIDAMPKFLWIGQRSNATNKVKSCYFAELCIKPYEDISTTHYSSGLPYYDPNKIYGNNGLFSILENGVISCFYLARIKQDTEVVTLQEEVADLDATKAEQSTTISASNGLTGGGDLTANRTISGINATTSAKGVVQLNDTFTSTSVTQAATPNAVKFLYERILTLASRQVNNWTIVTNPGPGGGALSGVCYSTTEELFVSVGINGDVSYSADGASWTNTTIADGDLTGICYSVIESRFVAVGGAATNNVAYSADGASWTSITITTGNFYDVCYSETEGRFVAVGSSITNNIAYSADGVNWTSITIANEVCRGVCYSEALGLFVAVGIGSTNNISYSEDGINWTNITIPNGELYKVVYAETLGIFVAIGTASTDNVAYSIDGKNWTTTTIVDKNFMGIAYSDLKNLFVIVGQGGVPSNIAYA